MKNIAFLHDTPLTISRGAELTITQLVAHGNQLGYLVSVDLLLDFEKTKTVIQQADLIIFNSSSRCNYELELISFLLKSGKKYVKVEYDYNFCTRRNILCTIDKSIRYCCHTDKYHIYRELFLNAEFCVFQSPKHYQSHYEFYGEAVSNKMIMPPTVEVDKLFISEVKSDTIPFFGELNRLKGGYEWLEYAKANPEREFVVYGNNALQAEIPDNIIFKDMISNDEVLRILGKTKTIFIQPYWPEPSGRLAAEAFLSGCEIITNDKVGTWSFDFYPNEPERAKKEIRETPQRFWKTIDEVFIRSKEKQFAKFGNVLVYKSYGGLGDIFFTIPAIYKLKKVSQSITYALSPRLVSFFGRHLKGVSVISQEEAKQREEAFDTIFELGNYPIFDRSISSIPYITGKKVKQHSIQHYIDAVARFHNGISNKNEGFPYFDRQTSFEQPYYTIHPGAGFLLKIWPTQNYADLIELVHRYFPKLRCKIVLGKEDPNPVLLLQKTYSHIDLITGDLHEVGEAMAGAVFHIGNDAGITHVAGAFDTPIVGLYGPTGPGSWGSYSSSNVIIWGKPGNCSLKCNYDVILKCEHKVCLTSISPNRVLSGLFELLQKTYVDNNTFLIPNPTAKLITTKSGYVLQTSENELQIDFKNVAIKSFVFELIEGHFKSDFSDEEKEIITVFLDQKILFQLPTFLL